MSTRVMTDERLMVLIEAYGAYPIAWPEEERDAARKQAAENKPDEKQMGRIEAIICSMTASASEFPNRPEPFVIPNAPWSYR